MNNQIRRAQYLRAAAVVGGRPMPGNHHATQHDAVDHGFQIALRRQHRLVAAGRNHARVRASALSTEPRFQCGDFQRDGGARTQFTQHDAQSLPPASTRFLRTLRRQSDAAYPMSSENEGPTTHRTWTDFVAGLDPDQNRWWLVELNTLWAAQGYTTSL